MTMMVMVITITNQNHAKTNCALSKCRSTCVAKKICKGALKDMEKIVVFSEREIWNDIFWLKTATLTCCHPLTCADPDHHHHHHHHHQHYHSHME